MSYDRAQKYLLCIEPLLAEETLREITANSYPHLKRDKAKAVEKKLETAKTRNLDRPRKQTSTEDIYNELIRTLGNG